MHAELERLRAANLALAAENQRLRESRDATRYSEQHYRLIAENTLDLICEVSQHGVYTYVSPNHHEILGYRPKELLGQNFAALIHRDDVDRIVEKFSDCMVSGLPFVATFRLRHRAGGWRWLELAAKPLETVGRGRRRGALALPGAGDLRLSRHDGATAKPATPSPRKPSGSPSRCQHRRRGNRHGFDRARSRKSTTPRLNSQALTRDALSGPSAPRSTWSF